MSSRLAAVLCALGLLAAAPPPPLARAEERVLADPLAALERDADEVGKEVFRAYASYDVARLTKAVAALEARAGKPGARPDDGWLLAQAHVELLAIHRFYEREAQAGMPAALADVDPAALADRGLEHARAFAAAHPEHSDIERAIGELLSYQIRGMAGGLTKGPEAEAAIDRAVEKDRTNAWARFAIARMRFHNPKFAGGDLDLALKEMRELARALASVRVTLYVAHGYRKKGMLPQALFWVEKSLAIAPENPEAKWLEATIGEEMEAGR